MLVESLTTEIFLVVEMTETASCDLSQRDRSPCWFEKLPGCFQFLILCIFPSWSQSYAPLHQSFPSLGLLTSRESIFWLAFFFFPECDNAQQILGVVGVLTLCNCGPR